MRFTPLLFGTLLLLGCPPTGSIPLGDPPADPPVDDPAEPVDDPSDPVEHPVDDPADPVDDPVDEPVDDPVDPVEGPEAPLEQPLSADEVAIPDVWLYQAVAIPLGNDAPSLAPIVADREALVRVFLEPAEPRDVRVRLTLWSGDGEFVIEQPVALSGPSDPDVLASTANFSLLPEDVHPGMAFRVEVFDAAPPATDVRMVLDAEAGPAQWPADGGRYVPTVSELGGELRVRVVPLIYPHDGSDRAPDLGPIQLARLHETASKMLPVSAVHLVVDAPVEVELPLDAGGDGWSDLLYQLTALRDERAVPDDEYIYGFVDPAESFGAYCFGGCLTGLSWRATDPDATFARTSVGVGFAGQASADTFVHELGHAHGRMHAPCGGPSNPDPDFPYGAARLGVQGWDRVEDTLISVDTHADFMSYCGPEWISDYTYNAFAERIAHVNHADEEPMLLPPVGWPAEVAVLEESAGTARLARSLFFSRPPQGDRVELELVDRAGRRIGAIPAVSQELPHLGREAILVRTPEPGTRVRLPEGAIYTFQ